jgi:hypothetical protein
MEEIVRRKSCFKTIVIPQKSRVLVNKEDARETTL